MTRANPNVNWMIVTPALIIAATLATVISSIDMLEKPKTKLGHTQIKKIIWNFLCTTTVALSWQLWLVDCKRLY